MSNGAGFTRSRDRFPDYLIDAISAAPQDISFPIIHSLHEGEKRPTEGELTAHFMVKTDYNRVGRLLDDDSGLTIVGFSLPPDPDTEPVVIIEVRWVDHVLRFSDERGGMTNDVIFGARFVFDLSSKFGRVALGSALTQKAWPVCILSNDAETILGQGMFPNRLPFDATVGISDLVARAEERFPDDSELEWMG